MTQTTGNSDSRVIEGVKHATDLDSKGETELAVRHLSALIEELPTAASLHGYVALFLSHAGRFDEAIEHGRQAILLSPGSEKASLVLFDALWKAGQHTKSTRRDEALSSPWILRGILRDDQGVEPQ
jgi:tetratricopeptide (TPR) repeat protein